MKIKKLLLVLIVIIILLFFVVGCSAQIENEDSSVLNDNEFERYKPVEGGELVVPLTTLSTLNPLMSENISYYYFNKLIFEGMFQFDKNLKIENVLAEDYNIKDGGKIIDIKLRDNVYWHDGEKFTSEDVLFTINAIKYANNNASYKKMFNNALNNCSVRDICRILDIKIIDENNLQIIFDGNYSNVLEILTFPVVPKHVFVEEKGENGAYDAVFKIEDYKPIGTGPYKFISYEKHKNVKLSANEDWWKGKTYIKSIIGKVLESEELILTAFETGQLDVAVSKTMDWEKHTENERVNINEYVSNNYEFLAFNFNNKLFKNGENNGVRKAIAYGINRQAIIEKVYLGHATHTDVPIHFDSWLASDNANIYGYNLPKAKEELEKAGWKDRDGDGICEDENGNKLVLRLTTNSYDILRFKTANIIADNLKELGIEVIKDYDETMPDNITEEIIEEQWKNFKEKIDAGDFDIVLTGWKLSSIPELSFAFHSSQIKYGTNFIRYINKEMDQLLVDAFYASPGEGKRKAYDKLEAQIVENLPYVSLFFRNKALLSSNKVQGDIQPQFNNIYYNIEDWYIPKEYQHEK